MSSNRTELMDFSVTQEKDALETATMNHQLGGFRKVSWRIIRDESGSRTSDTELVAVRIHELISTYLDELKTPSNSEATHITITIQQSTTLARVEVIRDTQGVDLSGLTSANWQQVYLPDNLPREDSRKRQLFVLGNILLKVCARPSFEIQSMRLYDELENGQLPETVRNVDHWPFICSCLSPKFAERAFILGPLGNSRTPLLYVAAGGAVVGAASLLAMPALAAAGWSASGVVSGSIAAAWHSSIGAVASGSLFSSLQSLGATGAATFQAASGISGALTATASGASRMIPNFVNTPYRYLYDGDLNDKKKLEKLISCKDFFLSNQA